MSAPVPTPAPESITVLLSRARAGDDSALDKVFDSTYAELRRVAANRLAHGPPGSNLDATSLVSAACEKLLGADRLDAENRKHFFFILGRAMSDVLVEHARAHGAVKRGGGRGPVPLMDLAADGRSQTMAIPELRAALDELGAIDPEAAQVVTLRFLCGRTLEETAEIMGCTFSVARRNWDYAKAWLHERLAGRTISQAAPRAPDFSSG